MTQLSDFLGHQMRANEWSYQRLADEIGISKSGVVNLIENEDLKPKLETLVLISRRFNIPLWRLVEMSGFDLNLPTHVGTTEQRIALLLDASPQLEPIINHLIRLEPDSLEGVLVYLEAQQLVRDRRG